jgi:hypothetical protein
MEVRLIDRAGQRELIRCVLAWLKGDMSAATFATAYWRLRDALLEKSPDSFTGWFGEYMSDVDLAADAYSEDPEIRGAILEAQMRVEVETAIAKLSDAMPELFRD